jgi:hypothetical protein
VHSVSTSLSPTENGKKDVDNDCTQEEIRKEPPSFRCSVGKTTNEESDRHFDETDSNVENDLADCQVVHVKVVLFVGGFVCVSPGAGLE